LALSGIVEPATLERTAAAQVANPTERFYRPELDVLRFFAFFVVFSDHAVGFGLRFVLGPVAMAGGFGVDLFFALSAYLLTRLMLREQGATGLVDVRAFYIRRILRIWPLYFFFIWIMFCVWRVVLIHSDPLIRSSMGDQNGRYFLALIFLAGNIVIAMGASPSIAIGHLWSVCVEEQFYLFWPWVVRSGSRRRIICAAVGMLIVAVSARAIAAQLGFRGLPVWVFTLTRLDPIAGGVLLAVAPDDWCAGLGRPARVMLVLLGLACWWFAAGWCELPPLSSQRSGLQMGLGYPAAALGSVAFLAAALGAGNPNSKFFLKRWLVYLGKISYGLYVYHVFIIMTCRDLIYHLITGWAAHFGRPFPLLLAWLMLPLGSFFLTVIVAAVSYRWLEAPFLRLKGRFTIIASRPV
jgi:peptidoglycan/LPS O-acetylase OafA/YrhL